MSYLWIAQEEYRRKFPKFSLKEPKENFTVLLSSLIFE